MNQGAFSADGKVYYWTGPTGVHFKEVAEPSGTFYRDATPRAVIEALEAARETGARVRLFYGDKTTGRDWGEEHDVVGRVGRSTGPVKCPILLANARSHGGGAILCDCVVRLLVEGHEVYRHPLYKDPVFSVSEAPKDACDKGYAVGVYNGKENVANFKTGAKARRWVAFMRGDRMAA